MAELKDDKIADLERRLSFLEKLHILGGLAVFILLVVAYIKLKK